MPLDRPSTPGPSSSNLYFVMTERRDSEGRLINGQWRGISGWIEGFKGPTTIEEARRIQAMIGAKIIPVEIEDYEGLLIQACRNAGVTPPEALMERAMEEDDSGDFEAIAEEEAEEEEDDSEEEEDDDSDEEAEAKRPEYPGYHDAIEIFGDHDFDYIEEGGGRKEENVKDAWEIFADKVASGELGE